jgi:hypothetical protein
VDHSQSLQLRLTETENKLALALAHNADLERRIQSWKNDSCGLCDHCWVDRSTSKPKKGGGPKTAADIVKQSESSSKEEPPFILKLRPRKEKKSPPTNLGLAIELALPEKPPLEEEPLKKKVADVKPKPESSAPVEEQKNLARDALAIPRPRPFPEGITLEEKNRLITESKLPKWVSRGLDLNPSRFLKDLKEKRVTRDNFNDWSRVIHEPTRAELIKEWTGVKNTFSGTKLIKRPKSEQEHKFVSAYQRMLAKCNKFKQTGIVPTELPDPPQQKASSSKSRSSSPKPSTPKGKARSQSPKPDPKPDESGPATPAPQISGMELAKAMTDFLSKYIQ